MPTGIYCRIESKQAKELICNLEVVSCSCGCGQLIFPNKYNYKKIMNNEPVYIVGHNARVYTYFTENEFKQIQSKRLKNNKYAKRDVVCDEQYHNRMFILSKQKCVFCGMTNNVHILRYGYRLHMHCRDGNYCNEDMTNWECVCVKDHIKLDILDFRSINQWKTGIKGSIKGLTL